VVTSVLVVFPPVLWLHLDSCEKMSTLVDVELDAVEPGPPAVGGRCGLLLFGVVEGAQTLDMKDMADKKKNGKSTSTNG
jgi:hypothetical protein